MNIYIEFDPRQRCYYYGVLKEYPGKIAWLNKLFYSIDEAEEEIYQRYPDAVIHLKR